MSDILTVTAKAEGVDEASAQRDALQAKADRLVATLREARDLIAALASAPAPPLVGISATPSEPS